MALTSVGETPPRPLWGSNADRWWWELVVQVEVDELVALRIMARWRNKRQHGLGVYSWEFPGGVLVAALVGSATVFWRVPAEQLEAVLTILLAVQRSSGYVDWHV